MRQSALLSFFFVLCLAACARSSEPSGRDGGEADAAMDGAVDTSVSRDTAVPPDTTIVGPSCGDVVCDIFEGCVDGVCAPYAPCVADSECEAAEICRNRFCIPRTTDVDGDGVTAETDCDEANPTRYPGATEACNLIDEDCDDAVDEMVMQACTTACGVGTETCVGGAFTGCDAPPVGAETCDGVDEDCDGATDESLTRGCSTACGSGNESCSAGAWVMCDAPPALAETCNLDDDDCDGSCDEAVSGCRRPVHRSYKSSTGEHFYTTSRAEAASAGFVVERYDFYYLYAASQPGLVPFYRCLLSSGFHFYTQSAACEGSPGAVMESIMGYMARTAGVCGSVPLYRMRKGNDHFYTTSIAERDNAVGALGYILEGNAGYVWPSG